MELRRPLLALAAGIATFGLVTVAVTEALLPSIEFSVLVGLPVGVAAGAAVAAAVFLGLDPGAAPPRRRRVAAAVGLFGAVTLAAFFLTTVGGGVRNSVALPVAVAAGALVGIGSYVRSRRNEGREAGPAT